MQEWADVGIEETAGATGDELDALRRQREDKGSPLCAKLIFSLTFFGSSVVVNDLERTEGPDFNCRLCTWAVNYLMCSPWVL